MDETARRQREGIFLRRSEEAERRKDALAVVRLHALEVVALDHGVIDRETRHWVERGLALHREKQKRTLDQAVSRGNTSRGRMDLPFPPLHRAVVTQFRRNRMGS